MSEYRRFIAYFYEYIDGKKQKNAGFAKVELRNGMWRILFRLNTETEPLRPVRAYGFVREQGWQLGLYMGSMLPEWCEWRNGPIAPISPSGRENMALRRLQGYGFRVRMEEGM